jgi:hypothetical protein
MPEAVTPVAPVVTPTAPTAPAATPAATPASDAAAAKAEGVTLAEYKELQKSRDKYARQSIELKRNHETERKTWGEKLTAADADAQFRRLLKTNPIAALEKELGPKAWDRLVEMKMNGTLPADMINERVEAVEANFKAELEKRDAAAKTERESSAQRQVEADLKAFGDEVTRTYRGVAKDYPVLSGYPEADVVRTLQQVIRQRYEASIKRDEGGSVIEDGHVMTTKEAADYLEEQEVSRAERVASAEKYRDRVSAKLQPVKPSGTVSTSQAQDRQKTPQAQRRTLTNQISGSTQERKPHRTEAERREAAIAAARAAATKP